MRTRSLLWASGSLFTILVLGAMPVSGAAESGTRHGAAVPLGDGSANAYVTVEGNRIVAVGVRISEAGLANLPPEPNTHSRCFDRNGNGQLEGHDECLGDYEMELEIPAAAPASAAMPFRWIALNWEAHGHAPPGVYDVPHFDFHFYMVDRESVRAIRVGGCADFIDCDDLEVARMPVPAGYTPGGYIEVGAAVGDMGNHLVNTASPEFADPPAPFTHTFIYGIYGGHVTFLEPMITRDFLAGRPNLCVPITQPAGWERTGSYPTEYCMRYLPDEQVLTVSLEGFVDRVAMSAGG